MLSSVPPRQAGGSDGGGELGHIDPGNLHHATDARPRSIDLKIASRCFGLHPSFVVAVAYREHVHGDRRSEAGLKQGRITEPDADEDSILDFLAWSPWQYHMYEDEFVEYWTAANAIMKKLERMPPAVRSKLKRIDIRCPARGCKLATVYQVPCRPTAEDIEHHRRHAMRDADGKPKYPLAPVDYFYVGRTAGGSDVYDILNYASSRTWKDKVRGCSCCRIIYWRSGCRHGTASIDREAIYDMFGLADRLVHFHTTEEKTVAGLPDDLRPFWGKRVFHPGHAAWHPKKRAQRR